MERFAVVAYFGLLLLCACAVGPDFKRPEITVAGSWRATDPRLTTQTAADSQWWKSFNDPTLDHLVELAYRQNLPLQIAGLRIVEARAQFGIATGQQFPADAGDLRERDGDRAAPVARHRRGDQPTPGQLPGGLRRRVGAGLLGQVPPRRGGRGGRAARLGGRLSSGARLADRRGRAHLRRDPHLRGADRQAAGERQGPGGGAADRRSRASGTARPRSSTRPRRRRCSRARARRSRSCRPRCSRHGTR